MITIHTLRVLSRRQGNHVIQQNQEGDPEGQAYQSNNQNKACVCDRKSVPRQLDKWVRATKFRGICSQ